MYDVYANGCYMDMYMDMNVYRYDLDSYGWSPDHMDDHIGDRYMNGNIFWIYMVDRW